MIPFLLVSLGILALSMGIAIFCLIKRKTALGIILGFLVIVAMEAYLQISLKISIQNYIDRACGAIGLPSGCPEAEFGCTEWSGLSVFVYWVVGFAQTAILLITVLIGYIIQTIRKSNQTTDITLSSNRNS